MADNKRPNEKQPGEMPGGKYHYNPGNQSGKVAENVPKDKHRQGRLNEEASVLPASLPDRSRNYRLVSCSTMSACSGDRLGGSIKFKMKRRTTAKATAKKRATATSNPKLAIAGSGT